jgi:hypothetical protein
MTTPQISQLQKQLTTRRTRLALQTKILDIAAYALEWSKLAAEFEQAGWVHNAGICSSNAARYGAMDAGAYRRLMEEIPVTLEKDENIKMYTVCDTFTKHVRLDSPEGEFIGWMCGCGTFVPVLTTEKVAIS